jgi:hypothetical protein
MTDTANQHVEHAPEDLRVAKAKGRATEVDHHFRHCKGAADVLRMVFRTLSEAAQLADHGGTPLFKESFDRATRLHEQIEDASYASRQMAADYVALSASVERLEARNRELANRCEEQNKLLQQRHRELTQMGEILDGVMIPRETRSYHAVGAGRVLDPPARLASLAMLVRTYRECVAAYLNSAAKAQGRTVHYQRMKKTASRIERDANSDFVHAHDEEALGKR